MMFPKYKYFRSKQHLKNVASLPCQYCGAEGQTQAAHSNWALFGNKGKGIKASDEYTAALCQTCHYQLDQGSKLSKQERQDMWTEAHKRTYNKLKSLGLWSKDVPMPY
jgi:hypothetical protein